MGAGRWRQDGTSGRGAEDVHQAGIGFGDPRHRVAALRSRSRPCSRPPPCRQLSTRNWRLLPAADADRRDVLAASSSAPPSGTASRRRSPSARCGSIPRNPSRTSFWLWRASEFGLGRSAAAPRAVLGRPGRGRHVDWASMRNLFGRSQYPTPPIDHSQRAWPHCGDKLPVIVPGKPAAGENRWTKATATVHNWSRLQFWEDRNAWIDAGMAAALPQDPRPCGAPARQPGDRVALGRGTDRAHQLSRRPRRAR